jgi:hypothetical protein
MTRKVWTFWYGSYMNPAVLAEVDLRPESFEVARLDGYDIRIEPLANLGAVYLPEAVLGQTRELAWRPALCYIASAMEPRPAERAYVERILRPARDFGFPSWYVEKLEGFRS